jgi:hypothetical protein
MKKKITLTIICILFTLSLQLFPGKLAVLPELSTPSSLKIEGQKLFVMDGVNIYVYSISNFQLLKKFGKLGEGPGEFIPNREIPVQFHLLSNQVVVNASNKIIHFSNEGELIKEKRYSFFSPQVVPLGDNYVSVKFVAQGNGFWGYQVVLLSQTFTELKILCHSQRPRPKTSQRGISIPRFIFIQCYKNRILVLDQKDTSLIHQFDDKGNRLKPIMTGLAKLKLTQSKKNEIVDWFKAGKKSMIYNIPPNMVEKLIDFPEALPSIRNFQVEGGLLYLQTYNSREDSGEFFIIDFKGHIKYKGFLPAAAVEKVQMGPGARYCFHEKKYYYLLDNAETETWELHMESPLLKN